MWLVSENIINITSNNAGPPDTGANFILAKWTRAGRLHTCSSRYMIDMLNVIIKFMDRE